MPKKPSLFIVGSSAGVLAALLTGCASAPAASSPAAPAATTPAESSTPADAFDLDQLIADAKAEGELVVWDSSSSVEDIAELFAKEYPDIKVTATKVSKEEQVTKLRNEAAGGVPSVDALNFADTGALAGVLLPENLVTSWMPEDRKDVIPVDSQDPPVFVWNPNVFVYNPQTYPNGCPIANVWDLTKPEWSQKVIFEDPEQSPQLADFFSELRINAADVLTPAYQAAFGADLAAGAVPGDELLKGWAANAQITDDSDNILADVGGKGGDKVGFTAASAYYDAEEEGLNVLPCEGLQPFIGYASPKFGVLVNNAKHPNAAKLWVHFLLGDTAAEPVLDNGGWATNPSVPTDSVERIPGMAADHSDLFPFDLASIAQHWAERQNTQDLWAGALS